MKSHFSLSEKVLNLDLEGPFSSLAFFDSSSCRSAVWFCSAADVCNVWRVAVNAFSRFCCWARMAMMAGSTGAGTVGVAAEAEGNVVAYGGAEGAVVGSGYDVVCMGAGVEAGADEGGTVE